MNLVVRELIWKDWRLHRVLLVAASGCAIAALGLVVVGTGLPALAGIVWFFTALIVLGCMIPISNVINERKKQNLPFLMALPVSPIQYAVAKFAATLGLFLVPWTALIAAGVLLVATKESIPNGLIPMALVLAGLVLAGFCIIASTAIVSESEGWTIAATIACNSSYGLLWILISGLPEIVRDWRSPVAVWSSSVLWVLGVEAAVVVAALGLAFFFQARKRDFV